MAYQQLWKIMNREKLKKTWNTKWAKTKTRNELHPGKTQKNVGKNINYKLLMTIGQHLDFLWKTWIINMSQFMLRNYWKKQRANTHVFEELWWFLHMFAHFTIQMFVCESHCLRIKLRCTHNKIKRIHCQIDCALCQNNIWKKVNNSKYGLNNTNAIVCNVKVSTLTMTNAV